MPTPESVASTLAAAIKRKLRPGEVNALDLYIGQLERKAEDAREALRLRNAEAQAPDYLSLRLDGQGRLAVQFPGGHAISLPSGLLSSDRAAAMDLILQLLRARAEPQRGTGSPPQPVQSEIPAMLAAARGKPVTRLPPSHKRRATHEELDALVGDLEL